MNKLINKLLCAPPLSPFFISGYTPPNNRFAPILSTYIQSRNTYILKRRYPMKLHKKGIDQVKLKGKNFVYDFVENTDFTKKPDVQIILKKYVEGLGKRGDIVTVKRNVAYNKFLITGLADYATLEAIEKAKSLSEKEDKETETFSSLTAMQAVRFLESQVLSVVMNKETEWTIKPWHIRVSFRKAGIYVPENCIFLHNKSISGPDAALEQKEFYVTVTINNKEKANVRCRIHHWSTNPNDRLPHVQFFWLQKSEPVFPEDAEKFTKFSSHSTVNDLK